jgi:hypothetical protein
VSERFQSNDSPLAPTEETPFEYPDDKSQSKPVPKEPLVDSPETDDSPNESIAALVKMVQAASTTVIGFIRLSLPKRILGEGLIK